MPRGLLVLLAAPRVGRRRAQVLVAEVRGGHRRGGGRGDGRGQAGLPRRQRPGADRPRHRPRLLDHRGVQGRPPGHRGVRLPGDPHRRAGRAAGGGRDDGLQPQPEHLRRSLRRHLRHPRVRRPGRDRGQGARRGAVGLLRPHRRHGGDRRGPGRRGLRAARPGPRLGAGQLPDPVRGHPAGRDVDPHPAALPAHPGDGPVHLPRRGGPHRRRPGDPPADAAAAGAAHRQLDLPRRLPDLRGPGRPGRPGDDRRRRLHRRGRRRADPARAPRKPGPAQVRTRRRGAGTDIPANA